MGAGEVGVVGVTKAHWCGGLAFGVPVGGRTLGETACWATDAMPLGQPSA